MIESLIFDGANVVQKNLVATQGGNFVWDVELVDPSATTIDVSATSPAAWSFSFLVCPDFGQAATVTKTPTIVNGVLGQIEITVASTDLTTLGVGFFVFELKATDNNSVTKTIARGVFYVNGGV